MTITFALIGAGALWLLYGWLLCAIVASWLSHRKGYGEKPGLATALLLYPLGPIIWLAMPARPDSLWKRDGPIPRTWRNRKAGRTL